MITSIMKGELWCRPMILFYAMFSHPLLLLPRCVILAVHPCNVDFHNSQILAEAKKVDPQTKRTIPVLTKPDLIDDGAESNVKDLLLGKKTDKFELGFHMVKGRE